MNASARTRRKRTGVRKSYVAAAAVAAALLASTACQQGGADASDEARPSDQPGAAASAAQAPADESVAAQGAQRMPNRVAVLTWNICGTAGHCPQPNNPKPKIEEIAKVVKAESGYAAILLQEACKSIHTDRLADRLGKGWVVRHRTATVVGTGKKVHCSKSGKNDAGVAVGLKKLPGSKIVKGPDGKPGWDVTFTSTRGLEHVDGKSGRPRTNRTTQGAACLQDRGNKLLVCSSHFVSGGVANSEKIQDASLKDLHRTTVDWQKGGYRTIVGGDFNIDVDKRKPPVIGKRRMAPMYKGNFEADTNDKGATHGSRKIDYIFFSDRGWKLRGGGVRYKSTTPAYNSGKLSDHWMLTAAVNVRLF